MKGNVAAGSGNLGVETRLFYFRSLAMKIIFKDSLIPSFHSDLPGDRRGRTSNRLRFSPESMGFSLKLSCR